MQIDHINANVDTYGVTIKYATLADYFETVNKVEHKWPVYEEDFFPYADGDEAYWTGYFTSYANVKSLIRTTATLLRNTELLGQAASFARPLSDDPKQLLPLRQAQAESQHHDGVTGTSKNYVMQMYIDHLNDGAAPAKLLMSSALSAITLESSSFADLPTLIGQLSNNGQVICYTVYYFLIFLITHCSRLSRSSLQTASAGSATRFPSILNSRAPTLRLSTPTATSSRTSPPRLLARPPSPSWPTFLPRDCARTLPVSPLRPSSLFSPRLTREKSSI